ILNEIKKERQRQDAKWGEQNHNLVEWMAILTEEVGEASKEALEYHFASKELNEQLPENKEAFRLKLQLLRMELVQTAAVAVSIIESMERNQLLWTKEDK
ncbi:MAG TPA: hypothetical protein DHV22_07930, partial [Xanthomarina gelatinilytica]|nr:hypothetical protein [Xanthomarina gelatinilytica]